MDYQKVKNHFLLIDEDSTDEFIENILIACLSSLVKESLIDSDNIELIDFCKLIHNKYKNFNFKNFKLFNLIEYINKFINDDLLKEERIITSCPIRKLSTDEAKIRSRIYANEYYYKNKEKYKPFVKTDEETKEKIRIKKREYYLNNKEKFYTPKTKK